MKKIIIALSTLLSISAFADCTIMQTAYDTKILTTNGIALNMTTETHLIKDDKLLLTASVSVKIKHGNKKATPDEISRALSKWIEEKAKLKELATLAGCRKEIFDEIAVSNFSVGFID